MDRRLLCNYATLLLKNWAHFFNLQLDIPLIEDIVTLPKVQISSLWTCILPNPFKIQTLLQITPSFLSIIAIKLKQTKPTESLLLFLFA